MTIKVLACNVLASVVSFGHADWINIGLESLLYLLENDFQNVTQHSNHNDALNQDNPILAPFQGETSECKDCSTASPDAEEQAESKGEDHASPDQARVSSFRGLVWMLLEENAVSEIEKQIMASTSTSLEFDVQDAESLDSNFCVSPDYDSTREGNSTMPSDKNDAQSEDPQTQVMQNQSLVIPGSPPPCAWHCVLLELSDSKLVYSLPGNESVFLGEIDLNASTSVRTVPIDPASLDPDAQGAIFGIEVMQPIVESENVTNPSGMMPLGFGQEVHSCPVALIAVMSNIQVIVCLLLDDMLHFPSFLSLNKVKRGAKERKRKRKKMILFLFLFLFLLSFNK